MRKSNILNNKFISGVMEFGDGIAERRLTVFAASGCYYMTMSLVPVVMILCCILPYTPFSRDVVLGYVEQFFYPSLANIVGRIVDAIYDSSAGTLTVSIVLTLFSASASMKALMRGMDAAYGINKRMNYAIFLLRGLIFMVILLASIVITLAIMVYGENLWLLTVEHVSSSSILLTLLSLMRSGAAHLILMLVFAMLYTFMPSVRRNYFRQLPGAAFTTLMWYLFAIVFSFYLSISDKYGAFGYIGTVMVAMLWVYYCLLFLLVGGYINSFFNTRIQAKKAAQQNAQDEAAGNDNA